MLRHVPRAAALAASLAACAASAATLAPPRPISDAEREAVRLAAEYLEHGPDAFREALAQSSPLRRLSPRVVDDEIEARAGGRADVRWELRTPARRLGPDLAVFSVEAPSGLDDTLVVRMVEEKGAWRVVFIRSFHEPWRDGKSLAAELEPWRAPVEERFLLALTAAGGLVAAFLLLLGVSFLPDKPVAAAGWGAAGLAALGLLVVALSGRLPVRALARAAPELLSPLRRGSEVERLARLLPLRRRLEAGEPREPAALLALAREYPEPAAQLWIAQRLLASGALADARRVVGEAREAERAPWSAVLRARLALLESREVDGVAAYVTATEQGVLHDGVLVEALTASVSGGFERPDVTLRASLLGFGTRSSEARLLLSQALLADQKKDEAEAALLSAWEERPIDRTELLSDDELPELVRRPAVLRKVDLAAVVEAPVPSGESGSRAVALPSSAVASTCGRALRVTVGGAELYVPGGVALAPAGTAAEDAGAERRAFVEKALAALPQLTADPPPVGALVQPVARRRIFRTAVALAHRNRWRDLAAITEKLKGSDEQAPFELLILRAHALRRIGRDADARRLLVALGDSPAFQRRSDPLAAYQLGELFIGLEEYDRGIPLLEKVAGRLKRESLYDRVVQVKTERGLAARFEKFESRHFEVRLPPERRDGLGAEAARVLEAERTRLSRWLPARDDMKTTVQLLWLEEFRRTYGSGGEILGIYDGKIRVPLAGVDRFVPFVVAIVTHELAHALVADLTSQNAPRWFHEGLAQHMEMRRFRPNYITQYHQQGLVLSLPVVETVLERFPDPWFVEQAYQEAEWAVAYIASKWGPEGITRLLAAYRDGLSGDEALQRALKVDTAQLSRDFVAWSLKQPKMLHDEIVAYDNTPDEDFHWSRDPKEPLGKTKPAEIPESLTN